jgi:hypothetical protein
MLLHDECGICNANIFKSENRWKDIEYNILVTGIAYVQE